MSETRTNTSHHAERRVVSGILTREDSSSVADVSVAVAARGLRDEVVLGETTTDTAGRYRLEYEAGHHPFDLIVRATVDGHTTETVLRSPRSDESADLALPGDGRSEYDQVAARITPLLDGVSAADLSDSEIEYLARATGGDHARVGDLAKAARHAAATGLAAEPFYGLLRQGMLEDPSVLAERRQDEMRAALAAAAEAGTIGSADDFVEALRGWHVTTAVSSVDGTHPVGAVFAAAIDDPSAREELFAAYLDQSTGTSALASDQSPYAERIQLALHLDALCGNNAPLVRTLLDKFDRGELDHPRQLAGLTDAWPELIEQVGGMRAAADDSADYVQTLRDRVAEAYPTAYLAHALSTTSSDAPATRFLNDNPEFDILRTPVNAATVTDEDARHELAGIQRTFKLTRRFDAVQSLRDNGFTSALSIAGIGRDAFVAKVAGTIDET